MSTRTMTRSQRAPAATQSRSQAPRGSQIRPSQTQRGTRRSARIEEDDEDEEDEEEDEDGNGNPGTYQNGVEDLDADIMAAGSGDNEIKRKASELVRLALFTEHKRVPLKRDEISKKVLGSNSRAFARVFDRAQDMLQKTFGMELVELPSRAGLDADTNEAEDELDEARKATGMKKKATAAGSKTYILRSVLHPLIIEHAAQTDEQILEKEAADLPGVDEGDNDDDEGYSPQCYGSIISWSQSDHLGPLGILYTLLALILVSGRAMSDVELRTNLKRLALPSNSHVPFPTHATQRSVAIEQYLGTLIRQGYLDRYQVGGDTAGGAGTSKKSGTGAKRGRVSLGGYGEDGDPMGGGPSYEWRWGVRAMCEVGEKAIAKFIAEFMVGNADGEDDDDDEEEEEQGNGRRRGRRGGGQKNEGAEKKLERMLKGVERAAGGSLAEVK